MFGTIALKNIFQPVITPIASSTRRTVRVCSGHLDSTSAPFSLSALTPHRQVVTKRFSTDTSYRFQRAQRGHQKQQNWIRWKPVTLLGVAGLGTVTILMHDGKEIIGRPEPAEKTYFGFPDAEILTEELTKALLTGENSPAQSEELRCIVGERLIPKLVAIFAGRRIVRKQEIRMEVHRLVDNLMKGSRVMPRRVPEESVWNAVIEVAVDHLNRYTFEYSSFPRPSEIYSYFADKFVEAGMAAFDEVSMNEEAVDAHYEIGNNSGLRAEEDLRVEGTAHRFRDFLNEFDCSSVEDADRCQVFKMRLELCRSNDQFTHAYSRKALREVKQLALAIDHTIKKAYPEGDPRGGIRYSQAHVATMLFILHALGGEGMRIQGAMDPGYLCSQRDKLKADDINGSHRKDFRTIDVHGAYADFETIQKFAPIEYLPEEQTRFTGKIEIRPSFNRTVTVQQSVKEGQFIRYTDGRAKELAQEDVDSLKMLSFENFNQAVHLVEGESVNVVLRLSDESAKNVTDAATKVLMPKGFSIGRVTGLKEKAAKNERHVSLGLRMIYGKPIQKYVDQCQSFIAGRTSGKIGIVVPALITTQKVAVSTLDNETTSRFNAIRSDLHQLSPSEKLPPCHITQASLPIRPASMMALRNVMNNSGPQAFRFLESQGFDLCEALAIHQEKILPELRILG